MNFYLVFFTTFFFIIGTVSFIRAEMKHRKLMIELQQEIEEEMIYFSRLCRGVKGTFVECESNKVLY